MGQYALVDRNAGTVLHRRFMPPLDRDDGTNVVWLPVVQDALPSYNSTTEGLTLTTTIESNAVRDHWDVFTLPNPPTNQELVDSLEFQGTVFRSFALVVLDEINLLRTAASLTTRTVQQLKNAIATKMGTL